MKVVISLAGLILAVNAASILDHHSKEWQDFKRKYRKNYSDEEEEKFRMNIFFENKEKIEKYNARFEKGEVTFEMGINQFSDLLTDEVNGIYKGFQNPENIQETVQGFTFDPPKDADLPDSVNWTEKGAVTAVKSQDCCLSGYAFSATGALEGQHFIKTGQLVSLSEQNLMDCSTQDGNDGCKGGTMIFAFNYVSRNHGIDKEEWYPYESKDGLCRFDDKYVGATADGFVKIKSEDEDALKAAVATIGPISATVRALDYSFFAYKKGIYNEANCTSTVLNHGILVVGYGTDEKTKQDYWLIKNSWTTEWGEKGYMKLARNAKNMCGIASKASYPYVK